MSRRRFLSAVSRSLKPSVKTVLWLLKLMVPITLLVAVLNYFGIIGWFSGYLSPAFEHIGLSGDAAFVFITSILVNIYGAVAVMATLGFDYRSVVILSVMCLIAHNLIIETAVQKKTGASGKYMVVLRIASALLAAAVLNVVLPSDLTGKLILPESSAAPASFIGMLSSWAWSLLSLVLKMVVFIFGLNILQNILREFGVIELLIYPLKPLMKVFGLPENTSFLWIVANCVGLTYGSALLVEEVNKGGILKKDAALLNTHIAVSHSLLEDTLLFMAIGIGAFWLMVPRLAIAIAAVWGQRLITKGYFRELMLGTNGKNR